MRTNVKYFSSLTVPVLRERLAVMGVKGTSRDRKPELVATIVCLLDGAHLDAEVIEALAQQDIDNEQAEAEFQAMLIDVGGSEVTDVPLWEARAGYGILRMQNRVNAYMRQNGTDKLSKRQMRRINKNARKYGIRPWGLSFDYAF